MRMFKDDVPQDASKFLDIMEEVNPSSRDLTNSADAKTRRPERGDDEWDACITIDFKCAERGGTTLFYVVAF